MLEIEKKLSRRLKYKADKKAIFSFRKKCNLLHRITITAGKSVFYHILSPEAIQQGAFFDPVAQVLPLVEDTRCMK